MTAEIFRADKTSLLALFVLTSIFFLENFDRYLISVSPIPYVDYSSYSYSLISGTVFALFYSIGAIVIAVINYITEKNSGTENSNGYLIFCLTLACFIFSAAFTCTAVTTALYQLFLIRMVMGLAQSIVGPFSAGVIAKIFPEPGSRATAFAIFNYGVYLAFSLSLSIGTLVYDEYGWRMNYILFGILGIGFAALIPILLVNKSQEKEILCNTEEVDNVPGNSNTPMTRHESSIIDKWSMFWSVICDVFRLWRKDWVAVTLLTLASGLRGAAGYIWVAYTAVYFSELFVSDDDSDCIWSYNSSYTGGASAVCDSEYQYCMNSVCQDLNPTPWHNKGMEHIKLESYMSWIPLVGSAMGCLLSGVLSDWLIVYMEERKCGADGSAAHTKHTEGGEDPSVLLLSPAANKSGVQANATANTSYIESVKSIFLSGIGGRCFIAGFGIVLAIPFVYLALVLPFPGCFLVFIISGLLGEGYIGLTLTIFTELMTMIDSPQIKGKNELLVPGMAALNFFSTIISGNGPILIPLAMSFISSSYTYTFEAANMITDDEVVGESTYSVVQKGAVPLQKSMIVVQISLYLISGLLYVVLGVYLNYQRLFGMKNT